MAIDSNKVLGQVCIEWKEVERAIARGKGNWKKEGYIPDDVWNEWRSRREVLRRILVAGGIDPDDPAFVCEQSGIPG